MRHYLGISEIAELSGLSVNTIKAYSQVGRLPKHDVTIGRVKGWRRESVDAWIAQRSKQG